MRFSEPDPDVGLVRALAQARSGRFDEALATLDAVAAVDPTLAAVDVHRGTVLLMAGRRTAARQAYEAAVASAPEAVAALTALAVMATEEGRLGAAIGYWERAGSTDPRVWGRLLSLAGQAWEAGNRRLARPLLELFSESAPMAEYAEEKARVRQLLDASE